MAPESPKFLFVTCTNNPQEESKHSLREVRQHVMHDHLRKHKKQVLKRKNEHQLQQSRPPKRTQQVQPAVQEALVKSSQQYSNGDFALERAIASVESLGSNGQYQRILLAMQNNININPRSLQSHRFDPFMALPINDNYIDSVAWWHFKNPFHDGMSDRKIHSVELIIRERMLAYWRMSQDYEGLFHSLICLTETKKGHLTGKRDDVRYFHHKGQAHEIILKCPAKSPSEQMIVLMSCLAGLTLRDEGVDAARVHMNAVIKHNPDLSRYGDVPFRLLARNDLLLAAADGSRPSLPFSPRQTHLKPRAPILFMAGQSALRTMDLLPQACQGQAVVHTIFLKLHELGLLCDLDQATETDVRVLDSVMYCTEYHLCLAASVSGTQDISGPFDSVVLAAQLFASSSMRFTFHTWQSAPQPKTLRQLYTSLKQSERLLEEWEKHGRLESLLWVLFIGRSTARNLLLKREPWVSHLTDTGQSRNSESHTNTTLSFQKRIGSLGTDSVFFLGSFLVKKLQDVVRKLKINNADEFERVLRLFPWTEHFSAKDCEQTWNEIEPEDESCL